LGEVSLVKRRRKAAHEEIAVREGSNPEDFSTPTFFLLEGWNAAKYEPLSFQEDERKKPRFRCDSNVELNEYVLSHRFLPDALIDSMVAASNAYVSKKCPSRKRQAVLDAGDILRFLAIIFFMGICKLPCKDDYWSDMIGADSVVKQYDMKLERFRYIWKYFHLVNDSFLFLFSFFVS
jgi:hypothetical protein